MSAQSQFQSNVAAPEPTDVSHEPSAEDDGLARRQCGRCRMMFPGDPDLFPGTIPDWWLCPPCRSILLGDAPLADPDHR
jgi:hypothetical protein